MIENIRIKQIGALFSEGIEDAPPVPAFARRTPPRHTARVLRILREALTQLDATGEPKPRRPRQERKSSAT